MAALFHIILLWLVLPSMVNRAEVPPADSVDVSMTPPTPLPKPKPKPVIAKPAPRPAEKNESTARPNVKAPRLTRLAPPPIHLKLPPPLEPIPPMVLPATTGPTAAGTVPNSGGGGGNGNGNGAQDGIDYLARIKAYIDSRKSDDGHRNARDTDVVLLLDPDGVLTGIRVASSSGDPRVDDDVINQLKHMSPFPKPPAVLFSATKPILAVADKWIFTR